MTTAEKVFQVFAWLFILFILATIIFPVLNVISVSLSDRNAVMRNEVTFYPKGFQLESYRQIVISKVFRTALVNTIFYTVTSTILAVFVTTCLAYGMTGEFVGKKFFTYFIILTMYFSGGLIATYFIYSQMYGLRNTYTVFIITGIVSAFYMIVIRSQIQTIPHEILEAADIDGASEFNKLFRIIIPAIVPTIAAISMFWALGNWNQWTINLIYSPRRDLWALQYFLRAVVIESAITAQEAEAGIIDTRPPPETFQMAAIVMVAAPIVAIYPFVQKYFTKGILAGAVKG